MRIHESLVIQLPGYKKHYDGAEPFQIFTISNVTWPFIHFLCVTLLKR